MDTLDCIETEPIEEPKSGESNESDGVNLRVFVLSNGRIHHFEEMVPSGGLRERDHDNTSLVKKIKMDNGSIHVEKMKMKEKPEPPTTATQAESVSLESENATENKSEDGNNGIKKRLRSSTTTERNGVSSPPIVHIPMKSKPKLRSRRKSKSKIEEKPALAVSRDRKRDSIGRPRRKDPIFYVERSRPRKAIRIALPLPRTDLNETPIDAHFNFKSTENELIIIPSFSAPPSEESSQDKIVQPKSVADDKDSRNDLMWTAVVATAEYSAELNRQRKENLSKFNYISTNNTGKRYVPPSDLSTIGPYPLGHLGSMFNVGYAGRKPLQLKKLSAPSGPKEDCEDFLSLHSSTSCSNNERDIEEIRSITSESGGLSGSSKIPQSVEPKEGTETEIEAEAKAKASADEIQVKEATTDTPANENSVKKIESTKPAVKEIIPGANANRNFIMNIITEAKEITSETNESNVRVFLLSDGRTHQVEKLVPVSQELRKRDRGHPSVVKKIKMNNGTPHVEKMKPKGKPKKKRGRPPLAKAKAK